MFSSSIFFASRSLQTWRSAVQTVYSMSVATGLVDTLASGSIRVENITSIASNTIYGYHVLRFNDALQSVCPTFVRLTYGTANSTPAGSLILRIEVGTVHDGSGSITGTNKLTSTPIGSTAAAWDDDWFEWVVSGDTDRIAFCYIGGVGSGDGGFFSVERQKDITGANTGSGIFVIYTGGTNQHGAVYIPSESVLSPTTTATTLPCFVDDTPPCVFNGSVPLSNIWMWAGKLLGPSTNAVIGNSTDFQLGTRITHTIYSQPIVFYALRSDTIQTPSGGPSRILMRAD